MRQVISVEKIMVGTSPDFEGVVLVLNHERPEEILFALTPEWAIRIADTMREVATKLLQEGQTSSHRSAESHSIEIARERGEKLDS
jgi:hypothetical protein